jgi:two-component system chemotaxis response regulator CheB
LNGINGMKDSDQLNIIVIGASAGGFPAVSKLLATFPEDLNAAVFIVMHISKSSVADNIRLTFQRHTRLTCRVAHNGESIKKQQIYICPSDNHMLLDDGKILIQRGAYENHYRPSIDVLFRSAAATYGACVTGIILTGMLDDGTSGMWAIKRSGGICVVQDPDDAQFSSMPYSVINNMEVDYKLPVSEMGAVVSRLLAERVCGPGEIPKDVKLEAEITKRMSSDPKELEQLGSQTMITCPDCGGMLTKIENDVIPRFRCYTGHSFTAACLEEVQIKSLEESLWTAIRMMEERMNLLNSTPQANNSKSERAENIGIHVERLKTVLKSLGNDEFNVFNTPG